MARGNSDDSTWVAWLDYLPIIGTAKNSVETVLALINGNYDDAKQKGLQAVVGLAADVFTGGVYHAATTIVAKGTTKAVAKTFLREVAKDAGKQLIAANTTMRLISKEALTSEVGKNKSKKKRGEHVINNNVLKFFRNIIDDFRAKELLNVDIDLVIRPGTKVHEAYYQPLDPNDTEEIREKMVAHLDSAYGDANATIYGTHTVILKNAIVHFMVNYYSHLKHGTHMHYARELEQVIRTIVQQIDQGDVFVDAAAKMQWLNNGPDRVARAERYRRVRSNVVSMFYRLDNVTRDSCIVKMWVQEMRGGAISCGQ